MQAFLAGLEWLTQSHFDKINGKYSMLFHRMLISSAIKLDALGWMKICTKRTTTREHPIFMADVFSWEFQLHWNSRYSWEFKDCIKSWGVIGSTDSFHFFQHANPWLHWSQGNDYSSGERYSLMRKRSAFAWMWLTLPAFVKNRFHSSC